MKKTYPLLFLSIIFILFLTAFYIKIHGNDSNIREASLSKSFSYTGAKIISSEVYCWGRFQDQNNKDKVESMIGALLSSLEVEKNDKFSTNSYENENFHKTEIKGITKDERLVDISVQLNKPAAAAKEQYISVKVTADLTSSGIEDTGNVLMKVFNLYGIRGKLNSCITGAFDGQLDSDKLNEISRHVFKESEAKRVEGIREKNYISVSAYSPYLGDSINVNGKKVNLNLAMRYNSYENKTYIWLATPVITTEY